MNDPVGAREALIVEAIGDAAKLLDGVDAIASSVQEAREAFQQARLDLSEEVAEFERRMAAASELAKTGVVQHIAARTEDAARRASAQQSRAMADAARVAFGGELGATLQRLHAALQPLLDRRRQRWDSWLTHAAVAAASAAVSWASAVFFLVR